MKTWHKIILGDSRCMAEVPDESVHLVATSPPYWQLKDYGSPKQIGFHDSYEQHINNLNLVWNECHRILHKGCRLCVNIGDQFARSVYYGRYKVIPIRTEIIKFCETIGFDYMGAIIWQEVTTCNTTGGARIMGSFPYPRNGILKLDYEFILILKKHGRPPSVSKGIKELSRLTNEEWNAYFTGHWNFPGERQDRHLAMFPVELPRRLIRMFSFVGETVLDPFLGSGTTSLAARELGRNSIGYEINENFLPAKKRKVGIEQSQIFQDAEIEIVRQRSTVEDFEATIGKLPYVFKDPVRFDKKIDPRSLRFGSRVDQSECKREEYYSVLEIVSPEIIVLSSGAVVRLIGVREIAAKRAEAIRFLRQKTAGARVFPRYDILKYDRAGRLLCYLYLEKGTFLNAHLIKAGLALPDSSMDHRYRSRLAALSHDCQGTPHEAEDQEQGHLPVS